jgi:predicted membrane chloride channel (bestrophin family)
MELVHKLHTIIHHAASHHSLMIHKMFHVLRKTGFVRHHYRHMMRTHGRMVHAARHILRSVHHVFHGVRTHHVVRNLRRVHKSTITKIIKHSFRSSTSTKKVVKMMLKTHSFRKVKQVIKQIIRKAHSAKTIKNAKKALKKLSKAKK